MAPNQKPITPSDAAHDLVNQMKDAKTEKDLFKLTLATDFRSAVFALTPADKTYVAENYQVLNKLLSGRCAMDDLDGETLTITDIKQDYSTTYKNDFVVLTGTRENGNKFTALSSAVRIVRFAQKVDGEGRLPVTVVFTKKPHEDGKTMWHVREIRAAAQDNSRLPWES